MLFISLVSIIANAASSVWSEIAEFFKSIWEWFINSGLAEDTADTFGRIITEIDEELIPLMWDWINTIFGH